jgi:phosphoesterase RecJ-like protein
MTPPNQPSTFDFQLATTYMALTDIQQLTKLTKESKNILIAFGPDHHGDSVASALALKQFLEHQQKQVDISADGFVAPKNLNFLPGLASIHEGLSQAQKFTIKVDISKAAVDTISYDVKDGWLSIYLTPKTGTLTKNELRTAQSSFKYDLIITLNAPDLESLGKLFVNNTDLFYRTPVVNIDYHGTNEYYGQLNVVDITATSAAEIVFQIIKQLDEAAITKTLATTLLTGMIISTKSFKGPNVTPHALNMASQLIKMGADREAVIHNLYRTRSIPTLKLWGQALSHLKHDPEYGLVWTTITRDDFIRAEATPEDLKGVADELITNSPEAKITVVLYEADQQPTKPVIHGFTAPENQHSSIDLMKSYNPRGDKKQARFTIEGKTLKEAEEKIVEEIKKVTKK